VKNFSKSANRALEVLDFFAAVARPARASEIADALGLARSSADQLLKTLVAGGFLVLSSRDKTYFPSLRLARFGRWIANCYPSVEALHELVAYVHAQTRGIVTVTMQNDCFMQIVDFVYAEDDPHLAKALAASVQVGILVPVLSTAIGAAALSTQSNAEVRKLLQRARYRRASTPALDPESLFASLSRDHARGFSSRPTALRGEDEELYWSVAVPLPAQREEARLVLGITGQKNALAANEADIAALMRNSIARGFGRIGLAQNPSS
jgi:DNA-binding IclR family transcriptional regulator